MQQLTVDGVEIDIIRKKMKSLRIVVFRDTGKVRVSAPWRVRDDVIKQFINARMPWIKKHQERFALLGPRETPDTKAMLKQYREQLYQLVPVLIMKWQTIIGVEAHSFGIRKMRTRWGSCHIQKKHITLNVSLAKKPLRCLEFIIVHELVHLLERYHNKRFYHLMDCFLPDWRSCEAVLESQ